MGGLASSAVYLATSLANGPPPLVPPDPAPVTIETRAAASAPRAYVIVDLPRSDGVRLLGMVVADTVRLEPEPSMEVVARPPPPDIRIDADVIASHDQRIGVIRERIDTLRQERAEQAILAALQARLRRAEAARQLAVARVALAQCTGPCASPPAAAARTSPAMAATAPVRSRPQSPRRPATGSVRAASIPMPVAAAAPLATAAVDASPSTGANRSVGPRTSPPGEPLSRARLLLAKARAALTDVTDPAPAIRLTGLWQWEGSERWSLDAGPQRTA